MIPLTGGLPIPLTLEGFIVGPGKAEITAATPLTFNRVLLSKDDLVRLASLAAMLAEQLDDQSTA